MIGKSLASNGEPQMVQMPPSLDDIRKHRKPLKNVNDEVMSSIKPLDRLAMIITERVGTMGFFLAIFTWTILWCSYNIIATELPGLHWKAFDPFPAFVAYLLMSNVLQIMLMPLIMVGQNLQGLHSEKRAQSDFEVNVKAEREIEIILHHLEFQNSVLIKMLEKLGISQEDAVAQVTSEKVLRGLS